MTKRRVLELMTQAARCHSRMRNVAFTYQLSAAELRELCEAWLEREYIDDPSREVAGLEPHRASIGASDGGLTMLMMFADDLMIVGLTKKNVDHLLSGAQLPAPTLSRPVSQKLPRPLMVAKLVVVYGVDKTDILRQVAAAGIEVPQSIMEAAEREPS